MNESVKPRFAVDLNEIEKHLGSQSQAAPATPPRSDPLAELARIVGQDDPFQTLLAGDRSSRHGSEPFADDLFVARDGARANRAAPGLRSPHELQDQPGTDPYSQVAASYAEYHAKVESDGDFDPNFSSSFQDGALDGAQGDGDDDSKPARRGSRKLFVTAGVVMGLAVLGLGGALMLNSPATMMAGGEPPLIKATSEPSKVQPQAPGGVEIPNQNKQIYERAGPQSQTKVVNREEQPVDVRQATRGASQGDAAGMTPVPSQSAAPPAGHGLNLGEPRKVRTVSIRPDGTIISPEPSPSPVRPVTSATVPAPLTLPPAAQAGLPAPAPTPPPLATPTPPRPAAATAPTTPTPSAPRAAAATPAIPALSGGSSPQQPTSTTPAAPAPQPAPQRVAAAQPLAISPAAAPAASVPGAADAAPVSGFAVQLGVSPSEADARTTLQRLQQKFPDLGGATPLIRRAEVNGNTIFRVRVGPMSREDASSLCSRVQGQGGQCFVAKN